MCEDFVFSCGGEFFFVNLIFFLVRGEGVNCELKGIINLYSTTISYYFEICKEFVPLAATLA